MFKKDWILLVPLSVSPGIVLFLLSSLSPTPFLSFFFFCHDLWAKAGMISLPRFFTALGYDTKGRKKSLQFVISQRRARERERLWRSRLPGESRRDTLARSAQDLYGHNQWHMSAFTRPGCCSSKGREREREFQTQEGFVLSLRYLLAFIAWMLGKKERQRKSPRSWCLIYAFLFS